MPFPGRSRDVGFLKEGAFVRLFNLDTSAPEKKVTYWGTQAFDISDPPAPNMFKIDERRRPIAPRPYHSHGVQSQRYHASASLSPVPGASAEIDAEYTCKASQGAILALKSEANEQTLFENLDLKQYVLSHHESWCTYVRDVLRLPVKPSAIVMISGWVKTGPDWALAAFSRTSSRTSASLRGGAGGAAGGGAGGEHTSSEDGSPMHREGEHYAAPIEGPEATIPRARDQSIFIKRFKVRRRLGIVRSVVAGAGYHRVHRGGGSRRYDDEGHIERGMDFDEGKEDGEVPDLLDILLDYMFETTAIEMAVASDDDVACIVGKDLVEDFGSYLRDRKPPVAVDGSDLPVGFFDKERVIRHQRQQDASRRAITRSDWIKWPSITMEGASKLDDIEVFFEPTETDAHSVKLKAFTFSDPQHPSSGCYCSSLSPDGRLLAASFCTFSIFLWRLSDGMLVSRLFRDDKRKWNTICLAFSPDSTEIFAAAADRMVTAVDIRTGTIRLRLGPHRGSVTAISCSPYEPYIATASDNGPTTYIWDHSTGERLAALKSHTSHLLREITFFPPMPGASNVLFRGRRTAYVYNAGDFLSPLSMHYRGDNGEFSGCFARSASYRGDRILFKTVNRCLQIFGAHSGTLQIAISKFENFTFPAGFSADDNEVYATCKDTNAAKSFDSKTGDVRYRYELSGKLQAGAYSADGAYLAFCTEGGEIQVHDPTSGTFLAKATVNPQGNTADYVIAFTADGQSLVIDNRKGSLQMLNVSDMMRAR